MHNNFFITFLKTIYINGLQIFKILLQFKPSYILSYFAVSINSLLYASRKKKKHAKERFLIVQSRFAVCIIIHDISKHRNFI